MTAAATVLVADDQARFRAALKTLLEAEGYRVLEAADGLQALATCRHERPDVAVLDLVMPHMDGLAVCRALRADPGAYVPILFYSARDATGDRVAALRAGGDDFAGKDTPDAELVARVESLVRIRRLLDARRRHGESAEHRLPPRIPDPEETRAVLARLFEQARTSGEPLSLLEVECEGDPPVRELERVREVLATTSRGHDVVGRTDDGWLVALPGTHFGGAMAAAERIWRALAPSHVFGGVAIGVSCFPNPKIDGADAMLSAAAAALARARQEGTAHICLVHHQAYLFRPG